ncbi:hypothetical protein QVD17_37342 [Tagetes erecta]|uniref:Wall-associated receptor kinase galacturonan-binding domain-containing protein n=1 Tax=Tagetes erecta TaxID=13708 RepID=A0AAD8JY26_TARER|nr:hypothetical protein QVD17_37342 [Tagetes erecta]
MFILFRFSQSCISTIININTTLHVCGTISIHLSLTNMKLFQAYLFSLIFLLLTPTLIATREDYTLTGCNDTCGNNVIIPYPFGIGADCSINPWYIVECSSSTPYLPALNYLEVLGVNLEDQIVIVNTPTTNSNCQNPGQKNNTQSTSIDLGNTPFLFSKLHNKFVFEGCGNGVMIDNGNVLTGCSTSCVNDKTVSERNNCFGISCCQATLPYYLTSYSMNLTSMDGDGSCGYAFLVDEDSYVKGSFSINASVPVSLMWTLTSNDALSCCRSQIPMHLELHVSNGAKVKSRRCYLELLDVGNPYLLYGCEEREECAGCALCDYDLVYDSEGSSRLSNFSCMAYDAPPLGFESKSSMGVILGVSISIGANNERSGYRVRNHTNITYSLYDSNQYRANMYGKEVLLTCGKL